VRLDHLLGFLGTERSDQLVLEIGLTHVEAESLHGVA
jgi:hypothetical protein